MRLPAITAATFIIASLALAGCASEPPTTADLDRDICDQLVDEFRELDGKPVDQVNFPRLIDSINNEIADADGVEPSWQFVDSRDMLERVKDGPAQSKVLALDVFTGRCDEAGLIDLGNG